MVIDPDDFSRTEKLLVDRDGLTFAQAKAELASRILQLDIGSDWQGTSGVPAAVLTAVNCGARAFLGGVNVRLKNDGVIERGWGQGLLLSDAVVRFGGTIVSAHKADHLTVAFGDPKTPVGHLVVHATWSGWSGGVVTDASKRLDERHGNPLSGALAGAIAVSECFQNQFHGPVAARRDAGLSLWRPGAAWLDGNLAGPKLQYLPDALWLAGLGHLGQAYAWVLGLLDYPADTHPEVLLQDVDVISAANLSTTMLAEDADRGRRKTRVVLAKLAKQGFDAILVERLFDEHTGRQDAEPPVILCGFDSYQARRRALGDAGFARTIDAGLGSGHDRYLNILVRVFNGAFDSNTVYRDPDEPLLTVLGAGYELEIANQVEDGGNEADVRCGIVDLAGKAVAASFVGAVAAALVIAETVRPLHGGPGNELVSVDLGFLVGATATESRSLQPTRLGFIRTAD